MNIQLSTKELEQLRRIQKKYTLARRRYIKVTVLIMLHRKVSIPDIEDFLGIDDNTIYRYVKAYQKVGLRSYLKENYLPFTGKLTEEQEQHLDAHLQAYCYPNSQSICHYIEETFSVSYTPTGLVPLLHRLGYVYKQTKVIPGKAEEAAQVEFLTETLPQLLEEVEAGTAEVYYADGAHPTHNTKSSRGWIKSGEEFEILGNSGRKRVNINAAINAVKPTHLVFDIADSVNAQSTKRLGQKLLRKHRQKTIYLICDNARYNRNKDLKKWAEKNRVQFVYLPTYSPNLNLIERLWRFLRQKIINSIYFEKYADFKNEIVRFLSNLKPYKSELQTLMTLNFKTVEGTSIYSQSS